MYPLIGARSPWSNLSLARQLFGDEEVKRWAKSTSVVPESTKCFFAFDLLTWDGKDLRTERLIDRKQELRRLLARSPATSPLKYTEYIDGHGMALFQRVCELDLEGIVAKQKFGPYVGEREHSTWFKILNRDRSSCDPTAHQR